MISFDQLVLDSDSPIYLQIIRHLKRGIAAGTVRDREELPSRRVLSALLGVNPNTVQRAYRLLEEEGLIESRAGAKSYVAIHHGDTERIRAQLVQEEILSLISGLKQMGVSREDALQTLRELWETSEKTEEEP